MESPLNQDQSLTFGTAAQFASPKLLAAVLVILVAAVYLPGLSGQFIMDDSDLIQGRSALLNSPGGLREVVTHSFWWGAPGEGNKQDLYRPWISATYWLEHKFAGATPVPYHVSNLLVHAANTVLILVLLIPIAGVAEAFVIALLSGLCPAAMTSVGWVAGRTDEWALLFSLVFLLLFRAARRKESTAWLLGSLLALFLALASKEVAIFAPVLALLLDRVTRHKEKLDSCTKSPAKSKAASYYAALGIPLILYFVLRSAALAPGGARMALMAHAIRNLPFSAEEYVRTATHVLVPLQYSFQSDIVWSNPGGRSVMFAVVWVVFLALVGVTLSGLGRRKLWAVGALWFGLALFPAYGLGESFAPTADFYAYFGLAGFWLLIVDGSWQLLKRKQTDPLKTSRGFLLAVAVVALVFGGLTALRLPILHSEESLWTHEVEREPRCERAFSQLADIRFRTGRMDEGLALAQRAQKASPNAWYPHLTQAQYYLDRGDVQNAAPHADALAELAPRELRAQAMIARFYYVAGHCAEAVDTYRQAFSIQRPGPDILFGYGQALLCVNGNAEARDVFKEVLRLRPQWPQAITSLGNAYENLGDPGRAAQAYETSAKLKPDWMNTWESLVRVYLKLGREEEAQKAADHFLSLNPPQERVSRVLDMFTEAK
jgi:protein O-mannosyl-transferase